MAPPLHAAAVERALRAALHENEQRAREAGSAQPVQPFAQVLGPERYRRWRRASRFAKDEPARLPRGELAILLWPLAPSGIFAALEERTIRELVGRPQLELLPARMSAEIAVGLTVIRWLRANMDRPGPFTLGPPIAELIDAGGRRRLFALDVAKELFAPERDPEPAGV